MRGLGRAWTRLTNAVAGRHGEERLREEMEAHLHARTADHVRAGLAPEEARRRAVLEFGPVEAIRQDYREETGLPLLEDLWTDVRHALRAFGRSPAFTLVALATLGAGIGVNVAVFGVLDVVLLRPLAVSDPDSLYQLRPGPWASFKLITTSYPAFEDLRRRTRSFTDLAAFNGYAQARLVSRTGARRVVGNAVSGNYFELVGVRPALGRFFSEADERGAGSAPLVVLSDALWRREFRADPAVLGTTVRLDRGTFTVVGVAPPSFHGTETFVWPDFWVPLVSWSGERLQDRASASVTVLGRLKPGVTPEQASAELSAIAGALAREHPRTDSAQAVRLVRPGLYADNGDVIRGFLQGVGALALLVLVAACANLASLFAARAADRSRELALRMGLGAGRGRLVRQVLTEALVLATLGGAAGLGAASLLLGVLDGWSSPYGRLAVGVDGRVAGAALAFTVASALLVGVFPARQVWRSHPLPGLKGGPVAARRRLGLRDVLLGGQIAACMVLVTASLVAVRGMQRMKDAPLGFEPDGAIVAGVGLGLVGTGGGVPLETRRAMVEAVRALPGVTAAGATNRLPMTGGLRGVPVFRPGTTDLTLENAAAAPYVFTLSPGYLDAARTRLLQGRDLSWQDTPATPRVALVNQAFARALWGEAPAIGERFLLRGRPTEVVGLVEDGTYHDLQEPPRPVVFLSLSQHEGGDIVVVARSERSVAELAPDIERAVTTLAPEAEVRVQRFTHAIGGRLFPARAAAASLGVLGLLAAMLALTGLLGTAAYDVSRRTKELGIRVALGARAPHVLQAAVGRPLGLLAVGSLLGLPWGVSASRLLGRIVHRADPTDPLVLGGAVLTMALLGVAASALPALRALGVDPSRLMREE